MSDFIPDFFLNILKQYGTYQNYIISNPYLIKLSQKRKHIDDIYRQNQAYHCSLIDDNGDDLTENETTNSCITNNNNPNNHNNITNNFNRYNIDNCDAFNKINDGISQILKLLLQNDLDRTVAIIIKERITEYNITKWLMSNIGIEFIHSIKKFGIELCMIEITSKHLIVESYFYCDFQKQNDNGNIVIYLYYELM